MGRDNKKYRKDLKQQVHMKLELMLKNGAGVSKKEIKKSGSTKNLIFSYSTYRTYRKHCNYFVDYIRINHPECTTLSSAKKYLHEWLVFRTKRCECKQLSAWTVQLDAKALGKLYGIEKGDTDYFDPPVRNRHDIKRSRGDAVRDKKFSKTNNELLIKFCKGTGARRTALGKLYGKDLWEKDDIEKEILRIETKMSCTKEEINFLRISKEALQNFSDNNYFIAFWGDKGGRDRFAPIVGPDVSDIVNRIREVDPENKVWKNVHSCADIHSYRADYASRIYNKYARPIDEIPYDRIHSGTGYKYQSEVYKGRKDEKGRRLDKKAMEKTSVALGHNRIEIVANNYLRGI